jgi:DnaJ-class molecular chaperone
MSKAFKDLPVATQNHLHSLITDSNYRKNADHASYDYRPNGDGKMATPKGIKEEVTKYGYNAALAAGTATRGKGPDPGRLRLVCFREKNFLSGTKAKATEHVTWWVGEHTPGNTYKYHAITGIPQCPDCQGGGSQVCPDCKGMGKTSTTTDRMTVTKNCLTCAGQGFRDCPTCDKQLVIDGHTIDVDILQWKA